MDQLTAARLRRSISAKLANEARRHQSAVDQVRKQYIFTIFLSRIFQGNQPPWVLLGGNALLIRTRGGRFTQDIDLARAAAWDSPQAALEELRELSSRPYRDDPFDFVLPSIEPYRQPDPFGYGTETAKVRAQGILGGHEFESFTIDLTIRRHIDGPVDQVPLRPVIEHETQRDLPTVPTTPVENHLADKVCAMYEKHGKERSTPSTRYRDLADIVRIIIDLRFEASRLHVVIGREAGRRRLEIPSRITSPGSEWETHFPRAAATFANYPREYLNLQAALDFAGACLDEVLSGVRRSGTWDPVTSSWTN